MDFHLATWTQGQTTPGSMFYLALALNRVSKIPPQQTEKRKTVVDNKSLRSELMEQIFTYFQYDRSSKYQQQINPVTYHK